MILFLEDNPDRIHRFKNAAARIAPDQPLIVWAEAHRMIREAPAHLSTACLICLDHDLDPLTPGVDPGDGLDAAKFLVSQPIIRPVLIHSSNSDRARIMQGEFDLAGWPCSRVLPFGDDWIESDWAVVAAQMIGGHR